LPITSHALYNTVFYDGFDNGGGVGNQWIVSNWANGHPFGCTFAYSEVWQASGALNLNLNGSTQLCGEVRTANFYTHGSFVANMKPSDIPGTISSFFTYTGVAGTSSHYEIDIEFIGGSNLLHTNYWIAGQQYPVDIDLGAYGIDPHSGFRRYGFEWRSDRIVWFYYDDAGVWHQLRYVSLNNNLNVAQQVFLNQWNGDNVSDALYFPGTWYGGGGTALYDMVWISD